MLVAVAQWLSMTGDRGFVGSNRDHCSTDVNPLPTQDFLRSRMGESILNGIL